MRYIGSKTNILNFLHESMQDCLGSMERKTFADLFAGSVIVSRYFKKIGCKLISNDYMAFSYAIQVAYIQNNDSPKFKNLRELGLASYNDVLSYLNLLNGRKGFFFKHYTLEGTKKNRFRRNYFSGENAEKMDAIRTVLNDWKATNKINRFEFFILLSSLIEAVTKVSNISGTYGAFLKFDDKRKYDSLFLKPIEILSSSERHSCFNSDIFDILRSVSGDVLYLDPPYNHRQYPPYYHILETVALYDQPSIYGLTGRRPYQDKISPFCMKGEVGQALDNVIKFARFKHIFLSYNNEGLLSKIDLMRILRRYGTVRCFAYNYRRFKSNGNGQPKKNDLKELLFYVKK